MISFKSFLTESRSAPLYHGTGFDEMFLIFDDGVLKADTSQMNKKLLKDTSRQSSSKGISTTRDLRFAIKWAKINNKTTHDSYGVFEFDQRKLTHNYQIAPIQYWMGIGMARAPENPKREGYSNYEPINEYEEFIVTNGKPLPLKYVSKFYYRIDMHQSSNMSKSMDIVRDIYSRLKKYSKEYPHIKFIPLKGSDPLD